MARNCVEYDFSEIESHWQNKWLNDGEFCVNEDVEKQKYYILDMFPYPSGAGLHIGHPEGYTASDILARYKKACGFNVLHPMGWDAFGLPAEQHAVATGVHPEVNTKNNIDNFRNQIRRLGYAIDWGREINTTDASYYKWTQWIFLQLFKHGLAYVDEKPVWWCQELGTVLANEEVIDGKSERGNFPVERRQLRQWVLRITRYADKLLDGLADLDWPQATKRQQTIWIGRSDGCMIEFGIDNLSSKIEVFTTRPDTIYGVSYLAIAPEHNLVEKLTTPENYDAVKAYKDLVAAKSDLERTDLAKEKTGVLTGSFAINPLNNQKIPILVADYVLAYYGTGAVMGVPAHDARDFEFAKTLNLPIIQVIDGESKKVELPFCDDGILINSEKYSGLASSQARKKITHDLTALKFGKKQVQYKLHDWLFSRQRYWGEPFPIIWIKKSDYNKLSEVPNSILNEFLPETPVSYVQNGEELCALPLTSSHLPLVLPQVNSYKPSGAEASPLLNADNDWLHVKINLRTGEILPQSTTTDDSEEWISGTREINTMPQWAGSCWYHLRYLSPKEQSAIVNKEAEAYWHTPDMYIGGAEHAVLHLLYARFWHRFLYDIGLVNSKEPFKKLYHPGIILGSDGNKMSKSRGNVVNPDDVIKQYGADTLRMYLMFLGPLDASKPWSIQNIEGIHRFLKKVWREYVAADGSINDKITSNIDEEDFESMLHQTIAKVTDDIENLRFNTAISQLMIALNTLQKATKITKKSAKAFLQLLAPFAPHMTEEIWHKMAYKNSISSEKWPSFDSEKLKKDVIIVVVQVNGKMRAEISIQANASKDDVINLAKENSKIVHYLAQGKIVKEIYIPQKLINFVVC